jgi:hypothetical protein
VTYASHAENAPRFDGAEHRLLLEEPRTNTTANSRAEGAVLGVVGSGGVFPTGWGATGANFAGLSQEIVAIGTMLGVPSISIRYFGTATATSFNGVFGTAPTTTVAPWTGSFIIAMPAAPLPPNSVSISVNEAGSAVAIAGLGATPQRAVCVFPLTATTGRRVLVVPGLTNGGSYDFTLTLGVPSFEEGGVVSTPILPPVGAPQVSTRGIDRPSVALADIGIPPGRGFTVTLVGAFTTNNYGLLRTLISVDDGTTDNRVTVRQLAGQSQTRGAVHIGGVVQSGGAAAGVMLAGTESTVILVVRADGTASLQLNALAPVEFAGPPIPVALLTHARLGHLADGTASFDGEVRSWSIVLS